MSIPDEARSNGHVESKESRQGPERLFTFASWLRYSTKESRLHSKDSKLGKCTSKVAWLIQDQWFLLGLGVSIVIASQIQVSASQQSMKGTVVSYLCVSIIFFITGCTLQTRVLLDNYSRWVIHVYVQAQTFLVTSAITYGIVSACASNEYFMDPGLLVGMIVMGCTPTGIASNITMTRQAHGNTALTVVQSTLGNFIGPFVTPPLVNLYLSSGAWYTRNISETGGYSAIYSRVFMQLGLSIYLPMAAGQIVQNLFPAHTQQIFFDWKLSKLGTLALLVLIWSTFDAAFATSAFTTVHPSNMIFIVFISLALIALWIFASVVGSIFWLPDPDVVAVAYCVPSKSVAVAVPLVRTIFSHRSKVTQAKIEIPIVIFQGFQVAVGSVLTIPFRRWIHARMQRSSV